MDRGDGLYRTASLNRGNQEVRVGDCRSNNNSICSNSNDSSDNNDGGGDSTSKNDTIDKQESSGCVILKDKVDVQGDNASLEEADDQYNSKVKSTAVEQIVYDTNHSDSDNNNNKITGNASNHGEFVNSSINQNSVNNDNIKDARQNGNDGDEENDEDVYGIDEVELTDAVDANNRTWRVKLYQLREDDGQWADNGTGHVKWSINNNENGVSSPQMYGSQSGMIHLVVTDEKSPHDILYEGGFERDRYLKQGDTIITWHEESQDGNVPADLALSFQDVEGCNEVWNSIQESCRFSNGGLTFGGNYTRLDEDMDTQDGDRIHGHEHNTYLDEIPINIKTSDVLRVYKLLDSMSPNKGLITYCTEKNKNFIRQLLNCFKELEEEKVDPDIDKFHLLFHIFKILLLANAPEILEILLIDEHWLDFFGVLEYNPDCSINPRMGVVVVDIMADNGERITGEARYDYRKYLQEQANFKQVAPIQNKQILKKIHMNFRLEYFLHCVEGVVTEELRQTATSMQIYNNNDIVQMTSNDKVFIAGILASLGSSDAQSELEQLQLLVPPVRLSIPEKEPTRVDALTCLKELCKLATQMQLTTRSNFYRAFYQEGGCTKGGGVLFDVLADVLGDSKSTILERQTACEILSFCVQHEPSTLRRHLCVHGEHPITKPGESVVINHINVTDNNPESSPLSQNENGSFSSTQSLNNEESLSPSAQPLSVGRSRGNAQVFDDDVVLHNNNVGKSDGDVVGDNKSEKENDKAVGGSKLLQRLCARLISDNAESIQLQCKSILEFLLDTETMEPNEREEFIAIFYDHYIPWLVHALSRCPGSEMLPNRNISSYYILPGVGHPATPRIEPISSGENVVMATVNNPDTMSMKSVNENLRAKNDINSVNKRDVINFLGVTLSQNSTSARASWVNVVDLLSFCVTHHQYRIKSYMLHNNVISKVLRLMNCREKHVKLTAIRFVRTCIALKDEFYNNKMVKHNLLKPIFKLFVENGPRDNLINSTVIELVDFVTKNEISTLASYIVNTFHVNSNGKNSSCNDNIDDHEFKFDFSKISYVQTFQLILKLVHGDSAVATGSALATAADNNQVNNNDTATVDSKDSRCDLSAPSSGVKPDNVMEIQKDNDTEGLGSDNTLSINSLKRARVENVDDADNITESSGSKRYKVTGV
jgi:hypothetical protein